MGRIVPVVAACIEYEGKVLLAKRYSDRNPETNNRWEFPGGIIEVGESPSKALKREIKEELGLDIQVGKLLHAQMNSYSDGNHYLILFYLCQPDGYTSIKKIEYGKVKGETIWIRPDKVKGYKPLPGALQALKAGFLI